MGKPILYSRPEREISSCMFLTETLEPVNFKVQFLLPQAATEDPIKRQSQSSLIYVPQMSSTHNSEGFGKYMVSTAVDARGS